MTAIGRDVLLDARDIWPDYGPTPLVEIRALARMARVRRVLVKLESERPLGNFKALGGMVAGLRALARLADVERLRDLRSDVGQLPPLVCASAGNHGLAVAAAARWAGTRATIYLAEDANPVRAARIEAMGGHIAWVPGTYDDAVERAIKGDGLVIADTSTDPDNGVVRDVKDGYGLIARELVEQFSAMSDAQPTHLFVQAGVGGLAAALTEGLHHLMRAPSRVLVVEPESSSCVAAALVAGHPVRVEGDLHTRAEMLACGLASAPAVAILRKRGAKSVLVAEDLLQEAVTTVRDAGGVPTTPSGATGLAGLLQVSSHATLRALHQLDEDSCVLLVISEGAVASTATIFGTS